jgi:hypothetical protein
MIVLVLDMFYTIKRRFTCKNKRQKPLLTVIVHYVRMYPLNI